MNRIKKWYTDATLRSKLLLIFFLLLVIPVLLFVLYGGQRIMEITKKQTLAAAEKTFNETYLSLESYTEEMRDVSSAITSQKLIYHMISANPNTYSVFFQYDDFLQLKSLIQQAIDLSELTRIQIYIGDDYLYSDNREPFYSFIKATSTQWYVQLMCSPSKQWFTPLDFYDQPAEEQRYYSYMRPLYNINHYKEPSAVLRVDISEEVLKQALTHTAITENGALLLMADGKILLSSTEQSSFFFSDDVGTLLQNNLSNDWTTISISGNDYYVLQAALSLNNWKLITIIPHEDITQIGNSLSRELLLLLFVIIVFACTMVSLSVNHALKRIYTLASKMRELENGNMNTSLTDVSKDEIGQLTSTFNHMANEMQLLMDKQVQHGIDIKNLEMKALQAQINPHFLYNTLDVINCLAIQNESPEIVDVVTALAAFYRISLSNGREYITIREEVLHAKMYLKIQNTRFDNQIIDTWNIDPEIENLLIPKIVLQPIIENAAIHGIYEREDGTGTICVKGWMDGDDVFITVQDNGVGMSPEEVSHNYPSSFTEIEQTTGGYGIRNICDRLHIAYGAQYGLSCTSAKNLGTTVTIHIPKTVDTFNSIQPKELHM